MFRNSILKGSKGEVGAELSVKLAHSLLTTFTVS